MICSGCGQAYARYHDGDERWIRDLPILDALETLAMDEFARQLRDKIDGVLAHGNYPLHTSLLAGMNNTIKVIKPMAYGYRNEGYSFFKIRAAFPGIPG